MARGESGVRMGENLVLQQAEEADLRLPPGLGRVFIGGALALAPRTAILNGGEVELGTRVLQLIEDCERQVRWGDS